MYRKDKFEIETPDCIGDILLRAAQYIRDNGWWRNDGVVYEGTYPACAVIAIGRCDMGYFSDSLPAAINAFAAHIGVSGFAGIYDWNDAPDRTAEQVIAALESAARARSLEAK